MRRLLRRATRASELGATEPDEARLLLDSGAFDADWYAVEAGVEFASDDDAVAHYLEVGAAQRLSPHPLFNGMPLEDDTTLSPLGSYLTASRRKESPHPSWDLEAYVAANPAAADDRFGALGHLGRQLGATTPVDVRGLAGTSSVPWGGLVDRWQDVARTWSRQRRLKLPPWVTELPDDHEVAEAPPLDPGAGNLVSIVIPTWNRAERLKAALTSVQAQTWSNWEALVVDDGSQDETLAMVERLADQDPRIRLFARAHQGVCAARNTALEAAAGDFIAFLDSDNTWQPEFLATMLRVMEHRGLAAAYGTLMSETDEGPRYRATQVDREVLTVANHVDLNVLVVRRELMDKVGGFDVELRRTVDYDLVIRLAKETDLVHVPVVGVLYDNDSEASDRITVRESIAWADRVQLKHRIDWSAEVARDREPRKVSVVVPVFQRPLLLVEQLRAVAEALGERPWQAVIVDCAGSRRAAGVATGLVATDSRITYERLPMRVSFAYAANVGFTRTDGELVLFLEPGAVPTAAAVRDLVRFGDESSAPFVAQPVTVDAQGQVVTAGAVFGPDTVLPAALLAERAMASLPPVAELEVPSVDGRTFVLRATDFASARGVEVLFDNELEAADLGLRLRATDRATRLVSLPGARVVLRHRHWQGDRSEAGRRFFSERHSGAVPDAGELWARLGTTAVGWRPLLGAEYAIQAVMGET